MTTLASSELFREAETRLLDNFRLQANLLRNPEWRRQMMASYQFFDVEGQEGYRLDDVLR